MEQISKHNNVENVKECKEEYCEKDAQCTAFVFESATNLCDLKKVEISMTNALTVVQQIKPAVGKTLGLNHPMLTCQPIMGRDNNIQSIHMDHSL